MTKLRGNFVKISFQAKFLRKAMKSQEFCQNLFALLLHNTVVDIGTSIEAINFSFVVITRSIKDSSFSVTLVGLLINCLRLKVEQKLFKARDYVFLNEVALEVTQNNDVKT